MNGIPNSKEDMTMIGDSEEDGSFIMVLSRESYATAGAGDGGSEPASVPASCIQDFDYEPISSGSFSSPSGSNPIPVNQEPALPSTSTKESSTSFRTPEQIKSIQEKIMAMSTASSTTSSNLISSASELSLEVVMKQMEVLKSENDTLKTMVADMNGSMKKNIEVFREWKNSVNSVQDDHRKKYEESRDLVESLRGENTMLKLGSSQIDQGSFVRLESPQSQIEIKDKEIGNLKSKLEESLAQLKDEKARNGQIIEKYNVVLDRVKESHVEEMKDLKRVNEELLGQMQEKESVARMDSEERGKYEKKVEELQMEINIIRQVAEKNEEELQKAIQALNSTREYMDKSMDEHEKSQDKIRELQNDLTLVKCAYEEQKRSSDCGSLQRDLSEALEGAVAKISSLQEALERLEGNMKGLQVRNAALAAENGEIEFLREQLDVFKADFEAERESRINLEGIRDVLQRKNILLSCDLEKKGEELERLHQSHLNLANEHIDRNASAPPPSDQQRNVCPICNKANFSSVELLQNHCSDCGIRRTNPFIFP